MNTRRLREFSSIFSGYAFKSGDLSSDGIPVIKIANIQSREVLPECSTYLPTNLYTSKLQRYVLGKNDTLIAMTGAGSVGRIGKMRRVIGTYLVNQRVAIIRVDGNIADAEYVYQAISNPHYEGILYRLGLGAGQPNLSPSNIGSLEIPLPPLPTQRKIAAILSAYDDLIENNTRRIKVLEEMAQSLYREWFVYFRFPGHEGVRLVESELGPVPEEWEVKAFGEVALNFDSKRKPLSSLQRAEMQGEYPYYGAARVFDHINNYIFDGKYLLIAEDGSVITEQRKPVLQFVVGKFWPNNHTHVIQGRSPISTEYLYLVMSDLDISGYVTGAAQPKITQANLNRIPVLVPEGSLLGQFNQIASDYLSAVRTLERKNANLRRTRDLLLPKLISGELRVDTLGDTSNNAAGIAS